MYQDNWKKYHKAVCSISFFGKSNSLIMGLTGFRAGNRIITDDQVYALSEHNKVRIRFYEDDGNVVSKEIQFSCKEFRKKLPPKRDFENLGFAYFTLDKDQLKGTVSFDLCTSCNTSIGKEALTIGFQKEQNNLSLKSALISSNFINDRGYSYIQFDGTNRPGTSGSPLIELHTGKVIGIVANKELQVVKTYHDIVRNIDKNLEVLNKVKNKWFIEDVDPMQVLIVNQLQLKHLLKEFFSNFTIKAGYALDVNHIREHIEHYGDAEIEHDHDPA